MKEKTLRFLRDEESMMRLVEAGCSRIIVVCLTLMIGFWSVMAQAMTTDEALKTLSGRDFRNNFV